MLLEIYGSFQYRYA